MLTLDQLLKVARLGLGPEVNDDQPRAIEWAMAGDRAWVVGWRPMTPAHA